MAAQSYGAAAPRIGRMAGGLIASAMQPKVAKAAKKRPAMPARKKGK
jgi:hypothetical protein